MKTPTRASKFEFGFDLARSIYLGLEPIILAPIFIISFFATIYGGMQVLDVSILEETHRWRGATIGLLSLILLTFIFFRYISMGKNESGDL